MEDSKWETYVCIFSPLPFMVFTYTLSIEILEDFTSLATSKVPILGILEPTDISLLFLITHLFPTAKAVSGAVAAAVLEAIN